MGSIPFNPVVEIVEPNQRALIAFNGEEQILILSTDLKASKASKVLEVIPLPSEPTVEAGDTTIFQRATDAINIKLARHGGIESDFGGDDFGGGDFGGESFSQPAGRITLHERIGAHEIMVARVERPEGFVAWVENYLRQQGVKNPRIPPPLQAVIGEYMRDNFRWFVFDVVSLGTKLTTKDAIQFRFKTPFLYYPMRITRAEKGFTKVSLLILS